MLRLDMWWQRSEEPTPRPLCGGGVRTNNYTLSPLYKCVIYRSLFPLYKCVIYRSLSPLYNGLFIARVGYPAPARINSTDDPLCEDQLCRRSSQRQLVYIACHFSTLFLSVVRNTLLHLYHYFLSLSATCQSSASNPSSLQTTSTSAVA